MLCLVILSVGMVGAAGGQSTRPIVTWESPEVRQTIGNGEIVTPMIVKFRVAKRLANVSVFTVPELQGFVAVQPSQFAVLEPFMDYQIILRFSVPSGATPGLREGTIHLRTGSQTVPQTLKVRISVNYGVNVPAPNAVTLSADSLQLLSAVDPDGRGLHFSQVTPELSALQTGSILALPPTDQMPNGFLGRVAEVVNLGNQVFISTTDASLTEAFNNASVNIDRQLNSEDISTELATAHGISLRSSLPLPNTTTTNTSTVQSGLSVRLDDLVVYDRDGNPATTSDQIILDGGITANPQLHFTFHANNFHLSDLTFAIQLNESVELAIKSRLEASLFDGQKEFAHYRWNPIVIWVGWIPVVIVPEVSLVARAKGSASVGIEVGVNQAATATAGVGFENGSWHPISDFSSSFSFDGPRFSAGGKIKGQVGPRFKLLLYGIVGPHADLDAFGEIDVDIFRTPIWQIFGGLEANAGVQLQILDHTVADQTFPLLIQFRRLIAEGGSGANGRIIGSVRDAVTRQPLPGSVVAVYRDGNLIDSLLTDSSGQFTLPAIVGAVYRFEISHSGYLPVNYNNVSVVANETKTLDVILQVDTAHAGLGNVSGYIFNAISGTGIQGLSLNLRQGLNATSGTVVASTTTGSAGAYAFSNLLAGNYTAEASGSGYTNSFFPIVCIGNSTTGNQNAVISPIIGPGQTRIVVTWGSSPSDLDSHFTGPLSDGSRFHMFYPYADSNSGSPWPSIVHLDLDDTSSFGPETTTLLQQIDGVYRFSVHDYSNRLSTTSSALSGSQAQVRVYRGSNLVATFNVPLGQPGTLWTVFEMDGSTITPINSMSFTSSPTSIMAATRVLSNDGVFLQSLPPKP